MLRFYEMMYYAIYRRRLEGQTDDFNYASRFYSGLIFLNVTAFLFLLNAVLKRQDYLTKDLSSYSFLVGFGVGIILDVLMGRIAAGIKRRFEIREWSDIATYLLVYIICSIAFFVAALIFSQNF